MDKVENEELNDTEDSDDSEETEETEETPSEESSDEETEDTSEETVKTDTTPEETSSEYTKERFNGLMSAWQTDRKRILELEEKETSKSKSSQTDEEKKNEEYFNWFHKEMEERNEAKRIKEDEEVERELTQVKTKFSDLDEKIVLDTALKYDVDISTAAEILKDIDSNNDNSNSLKKKEEERKSQAGKLGGKASPASKSGLSGYNPKLSLEENVEKGKKELGI